MSKKHGPVMLVHLGFVPTLIVSSADAAKELLKAHDLDCCSRPSLTGARKLSYNYLDVAFTAYGDYWREMRRLYVIELLSIKRVQSFRFIREEEVEFLIKSISEFSKLGAPVNLSEKLISLTADVICPVGLLLERALEKGDMNISVRISKSRFTKLLSCWEALQQQISSLRLDCGQNHRSP
ncbi:hypothetical protein SLEP1_g57659 [Rubroshorea leprosula]|uniref:Cytochrome P450 n=1 Tax=Rubroshorea leprosula TaxID=152421 RepID=A0AAV5MQG6_9ROSI|nr:hypothetical protein SLEP1_g57659 [Rubroshorea leprosula]